MTRDHVVSIVGMLALVAGVTGLFGVWWALVAAAVVLVPVGLFGDL